MNKLGLLDLYQRVKSREPGAGKWDTKLNEQDIKQYIKMAGSELTKDSPVIVTEMYFDKEVSIPKLIRAIHNA
jgi:hypothetical protein